MQGRRVHYVLARFPKLSETFVLRELRALEEAGWSVAVDTLESPLDEPRDRGRADCVRGCDSTDRRACGDSCAHAFRSR